MERRFKPGNIVAYVLKDLHGYMYHIGTVERYTVNGNNVCIRTHNGVSVCIPDAIPVSVPIVWADTLKPVIKENN